MSVLEDPRAWSDAGSGCESLSGVVDGVCSWDLSLGKRTGNEEI